MRSETGLRLHCLSRIAAAFFTLDLHFIMGRIPHQAKKLLFSRRVLQSIYPHKTAGTVFSVSKSYETTTADVKSSILRGVQTKSNVVFLKKKTFPK